MLARHQVAGRHQPAKKQQKLRTQRGMRYKLTYRSGRTYEFSANSDGEALIHVAKYLRIGSQLTETKFAAADGKEIRQKGTERKIYPSNLN